MILKVFLCYGIFLITFGLSSTDYAPVNTKNEHPDILIEESTVTKFDYSDNKSYNNSKDISSELINSRSNLNNSPNIEIYPKNLSNKNKTRRFKVKRKLKRKHFFHTNLNNTNLENAEKSSQTISKSSYRNFDNDIKLEIDYSFSTTSENSLADRLLVDINKKQIQNSRHLNENNRKTQIFISDTNNNAAAKTDMLPLTENLLNTNSLIHKNSTNHDQIKIQINENHRKNRRKGKGNEYKRRKKIHLNKRNEKRKLSQDKRKLERARKKFENKEKNRKLQNNKSSKDLTKKTNKKKSLESIDFIRRKPENIIHFNRIPTVQLLDTNKVSTVEVNDKNWKKQTENIFSSDNSEEVYKNVESMVEVIDSQQQDEIERFEIDSSDKSCFEDNFYPAPEIPHADVKYLRNEETGFDTSFLEVEYICHQGYKLKFGDSNKNKINVYCKHGRWIGELPFCLKIEEDKDYYIIQNINKTCNYPERCDQYCYVQNGIEICSCQKGFRMKNNRCEDINECEENLSACEYECENIIGSYTCKCPKGLRMDNSKNCIDLNECILRNGHGPCQDTCINTWGSYKCSCDNLVGSELSPDGHSCLDIDECTVNNGDCSHTCINTMGTTYCNCPDGWTLDKDWKTCIDIDECAEQGTDSTEQRCEFGCINTPGSYSCLIDFGADQPIYDELMECSQGYYRNSTTEDCQDINECQNNNGGCLHHCINTDGSFYCTCHPGHVLNSDRSTCTATNNNTGNISCPPLFPPKHGYLECSRPIASDINGNENENGIEVSRQRITNRPGSQCVLRCPTGFKINGNFSKQCSSNGIWIGDGDGTCIRYPTPKLVCPLNILMETPPNETMAKLKIPRPKSDVNFDRDISVTPNWLRTSEVAIEIGTRNITYTATHPISKLSISCTFAVTVLEGEPPKVTFCPSTQTHSLAQQHDSIQINWKEPTFIDNINVTEISRTNIPGNSFGVGSHQIIYIAKDNVGYYAKCIFKVLVNVPIKEIINHPLPIYRMFYK